MKCLTTSYWALSAVALAAGCGSSSTPPAEAQVTHVNWREAGNPHNLLGGPIVFGVRSIRIVPTGWSVSASVVNRTKEPLRIVYAHEPAGHNAFGIRVGDVMVQARDSHPPVPILLRPGQQWRGTLSGPEGLATGTLVRVQFGQFGTLHGDRFTWITDHAYRVR